MPQALPPINAWPVAVVYQSVSNRLKHVMLGEFITWQRIDSCRFDFVPARPPMHAAERRPRTGRAALCQQRQSHTLTSDVIPEIIPVHLEFVCNLPEVVYFRDLVEVINRLGNLSS